MANRNTSEKFMFSTWQEILSEFLLCAPCLPDLNPWRSQQRSSDEEENQTDALNQGLWRRLTWEKSEIGKVHLFLKCISYTKVVQNSNSTNIYVWINMIRQSVNEDVKNLHCVVQKAWVIIYYSMMKMTGKNISAPREGRAGMLYSYLLQ